MKLFPAFISGLSIVTSVLLLLAANRRNSLVNRLTNMAPGGGLEDRVLFSKQRRARRLSKSKKNQFEAELPDLIDLLCCAVLTGHTLHSGLQRVLSRATGLVAGELKTLLRNLEFGRTIDAELAALCERTPTAAVKEFANKLSIAISRGTPMADSLIALSSTMRTRKSNELLSRAGANETKMLIPLVALVLPTTVIFALYPSFLAINVGFN